MWEGEGVRSVLPASYYPPVEHGHLVTRCRPKRLPALTLTGTLTLDPGPDPNYLFSTATLRRTRLLGETDRIAVRQPASTETCRP